MILYDSINNISIVFVEDEVTSFLVNPFRKMDKLKLKVDKFKKRIYIIPQQNRMLEKAQTIILNARTDYSIIQI